jgi:hypothetical protein
MEVDWEAWLSDNPLKMETCWEDEEVEDFDSLLRRNIDIISSF